MNFNTPVPEPRTIFVRKVAKECLEKRMAATKINNNFIKLVKQGDINVIKRILEAGKINFRCENDFCLYFCVANGYYHLVKILVENGYLKKKGMYSPENKLESLELHSIFTVAIGWGIKNAHLQIVKYLLKVIKSDSQIGYQNIKKYIETITFKNFNYKRDYSALLSDPKTRVRIDSSKQIMTVNEKYNNDFNRNRRLNLSMYDQLLVYTDEQKGDGIDYDPDFKHDDSDSEPDLDQDQAEIEERGDSDSENELSLGDDDDEEENGDEGGSESGDGSESEDGSEVEPVKNVTKKISKIKISTSKNSTVAKKCKKFKSPFFIKNYYNTMIKYKMGVKSEKQEYLDIVLYLISQEIMIKTNYIFISNYCVSHHLIHLINILKNNDKFKSDVPDIEKTLASMKIDDTCVIQGDYLSDNMSEDSEPCNSEIDETGLFGYSSDMSE